MKTSITELRHLYEVEGLTSRKIAERTGMSFRTVLRRLNAAGVTMKPQGTPPIDLLKDAEQLRRLYLAEGLSTPEIADRLGVKARSVCLWLHRHGIPLRSTGSEKGHSRNTPIARTKMSEAKQGRYIGPDNANWRGGILYHDPERNRVQAKRWVKAVKDRDGWTCVECGSTEQLHAHHIKRWVDYPELRYELSNGKTLCHTCHERAHGRGFRFRWAKVRRKLHECAAPTAK